MKVNSMSSQLDYITIRNYIGGRWVDDPGVKTIPLFNPSDGKQIGEVPLSTEAASRQAIQSCHEAYMDWSRQPIARRVKFLFDIRRAMEDRREELAVSIAVDQAKHISEARGEVQRVIEIIETACGIPTLIQGETLEAVGANIVGRVVRQPLGVFCGVAPFNFPALVFGWFIPFAIGVGNTFVFKPSPQSPYFMQKMCEIFTQVGLPPGVVNVVNGDHTPTTAWYDDPRVRGICMVGSSPTARKIAEAAGRFGKRTMLMGGAKNYLVAMEDLQWDVFVENYLNSCYGSAGQRCLAGSIVAAVPEIYTELIERIVEASKKMKVGSALDPNIHIGPVISAEAKARIEGLIEVGVQKDKARLVLDGRGPRVPQEIQGGYYVGPTVFTDTTSEMTIVQTEIFGPVVCVMKVENLDHALRLIRAQDVGNGACIFTQSLYYTEKFIAEADVGMIGVNVGVPAPHPYLPFGGIKQSLVGTDKAQGRDGIDFFTQNKIATVRFAPPSAGRHEAAGGRDVAGPKTSAVKSCTAQ
jgi:malonate-semialdehyde dehydrogenase (acetylating)/methylmalonate-semialdehyde dehydrogenase